MVAVRNDPPIPFCDSIWKGEPHPLPERGGGAAGFTLVEVLVSLVILATAITLIAQGLSTGVLGAERAQREGVVEGLVAEVIGRLESGEVPLNRNSEGNFGEAFPGMAWTTSVSAGEVTGLRNVVVRVTWTERKESREFRVIRWIEAREQTSRKTGKKQETQQQ